MPREELGQDVLPEDVDAHAREQRAVGGVEAQPPRAPSRSSARRSSTPVVLRLLDELDDAALVVDPHDAERLRLGRRTGFTAIVRSAPHRRGGGATKCVHPHQVELVAREDQDVRAPSSVRRWGRFWRIASAVPWYQSRFAEALLGGEDLDEAAAEGVEAVGLGDVVVEARADRNCVRT